MAKNNCVAELVGALGGADVDGALAQRDRATTPSAWARAHAAVVAAVRDRLLRAARYGGLAAADAEDVVQCKLARISAVTGDESERDVLAEVEACPRGKANALVWTIGVRAAADFLRHRALEVADENVGELAAPGAGDDDDDTERLWTALARLAPNRRATFLDYYLERVTDDDLVHLALGRSPASAVEARRLRLRVQKERSRVVAEIRTGIEARGGRRFVSRPRS